MQILVIEDDVDIAELVAFNLERQGWKTVLVHHGGEGWEQIQQMHPDLVILDVMLPGMDGMQIFRAMKENEMTRGIPVIFLTARGALEDRLEGLSLGADDYVTKPFSRRELLARIKANIRRRVLDDNTETASQEEGVLRFGDLVINTNSMGVTKNKKPVDLTPREFELIKFLATQPNKVFSREELMEKVWNFEFYGDLRTVDVTVRRLREKIENNPAEPEYILTRRGAGYLFQTV